MIYLILKGRIGNQLFMYAMAKCIQEDRGNNEKIIIDDTEVLDANWVNSLSYYDLKDVEYIHNKDTYNSKEFKRARIGKKLYSILCQTDDYLKKYALEKKWHSLLSKFGYIACENGFMPLVYSKGDNIVVEGYFQSEKYFYSCRDLLKKEFNLKKQLFESDYPGLDEILNRNSVCISVKVEHNVGSELYDVCSDKYWNDAIEHIVKNVEDPLFFICSDNVDYVRENMIDCSKYDTIEQSKDYPVHMSLAAMSCCKHFIIGNTTFGWWAQYLSDHQDKIVCAPSKWMKVDMPIDIYQDNWTLIEV